MSAKKDNSKFLVRNRRRASKNDMRYSAFLKSFLAGGEGVLQCIGEAGRGEDLATIGVGLALKVVQDFSLMS